MKIIVITVYATIETALQAMKLSAADYVPKPFEPGQVRLAIRRVSELRTLEGRISDLSDELDGWAPEVFYTTSSSAMRKCLEMASQVAGSDSAVLLKGGSGTGKSLLARAIHHWSPRPSRPFTAVSCLSIPRELLESELFVHAKGAFTGAVRENPGRMVATEGGILFLDEVGDLPLELQPKRSGSCRIRSTRGWGSPGPAADIGLISASIADLETALREGGSGLGGLQHRQAGDSLHMPASGQPSGDRAFLLVGEDGALRDIELELKRSFELLDSAPLDMPDRHRGLETVFEYSWSLFDDAGRQVDKPIKDDGQPSAKMPGKRPSTSVSTLSNSFSDGGPTGIRSPPKTRSVQSFACLRGNAVPRRLHEVNLPSACLRGHAVPRGPVVRTDQAW